MIYNNLLYNKSSSTTKFRQASNHYKDVLEFAKSFMLRKQKNLLSLRKLAFATFCKLLLVFLIEVNSAIFPLCNGREKFSSVSDVVFLLESFLRTHIMMTEISLCLLYLPELVCIWNIIVSSRMFKRITTYFNSSKASGPDYIPVGVLRNNESDFQYILAFFPIRVWINFCFLDC